MLEALGDEPKLTAVSGTQRVLTHLGVSWMYGNVYGKGKLVSTEPLHAVAFEGYLDGRDLDFSYAGAIVTSEHLAITWSMILFAMIGLSQYVQSSKAFYSFIILFYDGQGQHQSHG
jgi:hypothetical protein